MQTASSRRTNSPRRPPRKKTSVRESSRSSETFRTISPKTSDFWNPGLKLYEDEDGEFTGVEFPAGQRYIDILAVGTDDAYVVIETKVSRAYDRVVGQILRYMGWIKENLANEASVRGIIVASEIYEDLILATSSVENIRLVEYEISFSLKSVSGQ